MKTTTDKAKYTTGQWETGSLMSQVVTWREERPVPICIADCGTKLSPNDEHERCANARLIAAAPELLEACMRLLSRMEQHTDYVESCDLNPADELAIDEARSAIAKATT